MSVYVVSYGEDHEGTTVLAVKTSLDSAKRVGRRHVDARYDGRVPLRYAAADWERPTGSTWEKRYSACDVVRIERWAVTS